MVDDVEAGDEDLPPVGHRGHRGGGGGFGTAGTASDGREPPLGAGVAIEGRAEELTRVQTVAGQEHFRVGDDELSRCGDGTLRVTVA